MMNINNEIRRRSLETVGYRHIESSQKIVNVLCDMIDELDDKDSSEGKFFDLDGIFTFVLGGLFGALITILFAINYGVQL